MEDLEIKCISCEKTFPFSVGEQEYLKQLQTDGKIHIISMPKRCRNCRNIRKGTKGFPRMDYQPRHRFDGDDQLIHDLNNEK